MVKSVTLGNGLRVIVKRMEGLLSVTMGILVGTGSAFERDDEDGLSHFIEHMQFKGTPTRTAFEISDAFDAIGAQVNAFTGKDLTCYYTKATSDHAAEAFTLLADLFLNADFPEEEMAREKGVVLEEINMDEDSPEDLCLDLLARAAFGGDNYGRNILGPAENVKKFTREDIFAYRAERYVPENIVLSFAGNIDIDEAIRLAESLFGGMKGTLTDRKKKVLLRTDKLFKKKSIEQAHLAVAFPTVARESADYDAVQILNSILGGGMSSRLFKRVREELGLAYSVYSYTSHYSEAGVAAVYAGVNPKNADAAAEAVAEVIRGLKEEGVREDEFLRAKEQFKASTVFSQESTSTQMHLYGRRLLQANEIYDFEQRMQAVSAVTIEDVGRVLKESYDFSRAATACVGNFKGGFSL